MSSTARFSGTSAPAHRPSLDTEALLAVRENQYRLRLPSPPAIMSGWGRQSCRGRLATYAYILPDTGATKKVTGGTLWSSGWAGRNLARTLS